ncbi:MAG: phosphate acyltransferase PlsX [Oscillospiraceae bacterium]|nr:phosphate acyltransferase PlsX [Oscillospiraceae bacterium]
MTIVIDGFGGDNAPTEVVKGVVQALSEFHAPDLFLMVTGDEQKLRKVFSDLSIDPDGGRIKIVNAEGVMRVEDNPTDIRTSKSGTSMGVALNLVKKGEADAMVSAGSTAALMVGGTMVVGRIKGIKRPALSPIMPASGDSPYILLDGGSNLECRPEMLLQFGIMGSIYMNRIMRITSPRVGLLNIGTEEEKGRELEKEAFKLFTARKSESLNFIGNVEAREIPLGACDVVVTDGFTGNLVLKAVEGMGVYMKQSLKDLFGKNAATKVGYLLTKRGVMDIRRKTDYREIGGAPLLGTAKPVIKAHGSSDAKAFKNAIKQAIDFVHSGAIKEIEENIQ